MFLQLAIVIVLLGCMIQLSFFGVIEMLKGYGKLGSLLDTGMPITLPILHSVLQQTPTICGSNHDRYLFTAMCTTVCFGFLRVGEITCCPWSSVVLQLCQIVPLLFDNSDNTLGFTQTFTDFKHSYNQFAVSISLHWRMPGAEIAGLSFRTRCG